MLSHKMKIPKCRVSRFTRDKMLRQLLTNVIMVHRTSANGGSMGEEMNRKWETTLIHILFCLVTGPNIFVLNTVVKY